MKILVADDNPSNVELLKDVLRVSGYQILSATDGTAALEMVREQLPDLVILDINMPGMSGIDVCAALKEDHTTSSIPIIMLTAMTDVENRVKALSLGADDYLTKPYSPRELVARIQRSLRTKVEADDLRQKRDVIRQTFERFVAPSIVNQMLERPQDVKLGGQLQEVTVMFADLEGFTSLSERTDPEILLKLLSEYHGLVVKIIQQYNGTIDKFIGDCVMALYNTPVAQPDHIAAAVKSALHIQDEVYWFHQKLPPEQRMKINFGIHTGVATVGNVGTANLMDFTAVGDTVNVAARLQTSAENGQIFVTRSVYDAVDDFVVGRSRGELYVKGRKEPVIAYEISNTMFT